MENENSWESWCNHVLKELERLDTRVENAIRDINIAATKLAKNDVEFISRKECNDNNTVINKAIGGALQELASVKTELSIRSGSWGALMGVIGAVLVLILKKAMGW